MSNYSTEAMKQAAKAAGGAPRGSVLKPKVYRAASKKVDSTVQWDKDSQSYVPAPVRTGQDIYPATPGKRALRTYPLKTRKPLGRP